VASVKGEALAALDSALGGVLAELLAAGGFEGKQGQRTRPLRVLGAKAANVALVGLGKREQAAAVADWGQSPYQVCACVCTRVCVCVCVCV
jgi:leucyl aminopeptidase